MENPKGMTDNESYYSNTGNFKDILRCSGITDKGRLCNKVLAYANKKGQLQASIKCPRCGKVNEK